MITFDGTCPHCGSDKGFNAFGMSLYVIGDRDYEKHPLTESEKKLKLAKECMDEGAGLPAYVHNNDLYIEADFSLAGECRKCHKPIVATASALRQKTKELYPCVYRDKETMPFPGEIIAIYPQPTPPYSHPSFPEKVNETFIALQDMIRENKPAHMIITGCRQVLEASVREIDIKGVGTLHQRIKKIYDDGLITRSLFDWAMIIKDFGNGAAHEMLGTPEEAKELVEFTKIFLQYTFEMPAMINALKSGPK